MKWSEYLTILAQFLIACLIGGVGIGFVVEQIRNGWLNAHRNAEKKLRKEMEKK